MLLCLGYNEKGIGSRKTSMKKQISRIFIAHALSIKLLDRFHRILLADYIHKA